MDPASKMIWEAWRILLEEFILIMFFLVCLPDFLRKCSRDLGAGFLIPLMFLTWSCFKVFATLLVHWFITGAPKTSRPAQACAAV